MPQRKYVIRSKEGERFDIAGATGRAAPRALWPDPPPVSSVCAAYRDPWVNPSSGGLFGQTRIAAAISEHLHALRGHGIGERQARRYFKGHLHDDLRWCEGQAATNVNTIPALAKMIDASAPAAHSEPGKKGAASRWRVLGSASESESPSR